MNPSTEQIPIVEAEGLTIAYRSGTGWMRATQGLSLQVDAGAVIGIVGESGSGKSTVAREMLGLLPEAVSIIQGGRLMLGGRNVTGFSQAQWEGLRGHPVAIVFQDPLSFLNPVARIGKQIGESVRRHDPGCNERERVCDLLTLVKLPPTVESPTKRRPGCRRYSLATSTSFNTCPAPISCPFVAA